MLLNPIVITTIKTGNISKALNIIKEVKEISLLLIGIINKEKYSDLVGGRCHERI